MKNRLRKALALLLCLVMCFSLLPLSALAEEPEAEEPPYEDVQPEAPAEEPVEEPEEAEEPEEPEEPGDSAEAEENFLVKAYGEDVIVGFDTDALPESIETEFKYSFKKLGEQLPDTLGVYLGGTVCYTEDEDGAVTIRRVEETAKAELAVAWDCEEDYNDSALYVFHFHPVFEGFELADGVALPTVVLNVQGDFEIPPLTDIPYELEHEIPIIGAVTANGEEVTLPSAYSSYAEGLLPPARNQNPYGTCWAHATIGCVEADLIHDGAVGADEIDLSELHLAYYSYHDYYDEKGCNEGDTITRHGEADSKYLDFGGSRFVAARVLANQIGPVNESDVPYSLAYSYQPGTAEGRSTAGVQIVDTYSLNPADTDAIKQAIMEHGGLGMSLCYKIEYFDSATAAYYTTLTEPNHAVMLVGWDDAYPVENFRSDVERPSNPGAWLVRNSWGSQWGEDGYFWMSYEDKSFLSSGNVTVIDAELLQYDHIYAYDGVPATDGWYYFPRSSSVAFHQYFPVNKGEQIEAIGFETADDDLNVELTVTCGSQSATAQLGAETAGYYLVKLDEPIAVNADDWVDVAITFYGNQPYYLLEESWDYGTAPDDIIFNAGCGNPRGGLIVEGEVQNEDGLIKVFTNDIPAVTYTVSYDANGGTGAPAAQTKKENVPLTLSGTIPKRKGYRFLGWATTATATAAEYQPGAAYNDNADLTLYAVWEYVGVEIDEEAFPDEGFRDYVARYIDDGDGYLSPNEIAAVKEIDLNGFSSIHSLEGVKLFTALETLNCTYKELVALDVSGMTALRTLDCSDNRGLVSLDVSGCTALESLGCGYCDLSELDLSGCEALKDLGCSDNSLLTLDLSDCEELETLSCGYNQLGELNPSRCPKLWVLYCSGNALSELDVSGCPELRYLECFNNNLAALDVSNCPKLVNLACDGNQLTALDLSKCTKLEGLGCSRNQLSALDVSFCPELSSLDCSMNRIGALDLRQNAKLESLFCYQNELSELDVSQNPLLELLSCPGNHLRTLDVSACPALVHTILNGERETGVYLGFTWTSFEVDNSTGYTIALIVDSSLAEHGLNPPAILPATLTPENSYLALSVGETKTLRIVGLDPLWEPELVWTATDDGVIGLGTSVIEVSPDGEVKALQKGTAYAVAYLERNGKRVTASCRIDVTEDAVGQAVTGVRLMDTKATVELYSTAYTRVTLVPVLEQNQSADAAAPLVPPAPSPGPNLGSAVGHAWFADDTLNTVFTLRVLDDRTLEIIPNQEYVTLNKDTLKQLKASYKSAVKVTVGGEVFTTAEVLTVSIKKTVPKVTVKVNKFNSFIPGDTQALRFTGAAVKSVELDQAKAALQPDWLSLDPETRTLKYTGANDLKRSGKLYLLVEPEGWNVFLPIELAVSAAPTVPKLSLRTAALNLQSAVDEVVATEAAVTLVSFDDSEKWSLRKQSVTEGRNDAADALSVKIVGNVITVVKGEGAPTDGKAHTYKVTLALLRNGEPTKVTTALTVKLLGADAKPAITAKASGTIDTALPGSQVTITLTPKNISPHSIWVTDVTVTGVKGKSAPEDMTEHFYWYRYDGKVYVAQENELDASYAYTAKITTNAGAETSVKLSVKASDPNKLKPSITLKATGAIDVIRPASAVTVTATVKDCYNYWLNPNDLRIWKVEGKNYTDVSDWFEVSRAGSDAFAVTLKEDSGVNHAKDKFAVSLKTTLNGTEVESKAVAITVKMGSAKFTQSAKAVTLLRDDRHSRGTVTISVADVGVNGIDWVKTLGEYVPPKDRDGTPLLDLMRLNGDECAIFYTGHELRAVKSATVKIPVFLKGNNSEKPNATISISVKIG